jgi:uncharacterized protein YecE (DUF72 family)
MAARARIGTSGWHYADWGRGRFYPAGLAPARWLAYYAARFDTVELNNSFYRLPARETFAAWRAAAPRDFLFAVKASRFLTHLTKLRDPAEPVRRLLAAAKGLGAKLGPILFQLPAGWGLNAGRLEGLFAALAAQRAIRPAPRVAVELREPSWLVPEVFAILERHGAALVLHDFPGLAVEGPLTADFVFVRRHGASGRYRGSYPTRALRRLAREIAGFRRGGRDAFVYFNNDLEGHAIANALALRRFLEEGD